jgi:protein-tyrosine phosphatase
MTCTDCKTVLLSCTDCCSERCGVCLTDHTLCSRCRYRLTCHEAEICMLCIKPYDWITDSMVIGNHRTPNALADLVVDLNFPDNQARENQIHVLGNVIYVGVIDSIFFDFEPLIDKVMNLLRDTPHRKILFRCRAGVSRSVTIGACYLAETSGITRAEALERIRRRRRQADPNLRFLQLLQK